MVLLSPSRTITDSLTTLVSSTCQQLENVWDEVGYSPEDRATQLSDLLVKFKELCEIKIAEEKQVAETFRQTIVESKEELRATGEALKVTIDSELLKENRGQTLTDELATLEAALEGLRTAAKAAKDDLMECRDYLIEAHDALGLEMDPSWRDIESDLTVARQEQFLRKKMEMKEELSTRSAAVIQLVRDCQHLMNDLGIDAENGSDLDKRIAGSVVRSKDGSFIMASKFRSNTCVGIKSAALEELTKRVAELHGEKRRRKAKLQDMGAEIAVLWEKLRVPEEEQLAFTESVQGLGLDTIQKGEVELARLHVLKAQMLGNLIDEARQTIVALWEQINAAPEQQRGFEAFRVPESLFNDELLDVHEEYINVLTTRLEQMKPILRILERREEILRERMEYEELQKDPERLKQRGAAMTRQLMEEEKMARRIKKELPRLTDLLSEKLAEWKEEHGEEFQYRGEDYIDTMAAQEEEWQQYKEAEMQRKLRKKQQEQAAVESRYLKPSKTKAIHRPLGDAAARENVSRHPTRHRSHDVGKPSAPRGPGLGKKQASTRF